MEAIAKGFTPVCAMTPVRRLLCELLICARLWHRSLRDQRHLSALDSAEMMCIHDVIVALGRQSIRTIGTVILYPRRDRSIDV